MNNLTITIAVIDDNDEKVETFFEDLSAFSKEKAYTVKHERYGSFDDYEKNSKKDLFYDFFLIDFDLGLKHHLQGDQVTLEIKKRFPLTDILFYSSDKSKLESSKKNPRFNGVYFAELSFDGNNEAFDRSKLLIEKVIQWYDTPFSAAGIIAESVSRMDAEIESALISITTEAQKNNDCTAYLTGKTIDSINGRANRLFQTIGYPCEDLFPREEIVNSIGQKEKAAYILQDYRLVEFSLKTETLLHYLKQEKWNSPFRKTLKTKIDELIKIRNSFAHSAFTYDSNAWICTTKSGEIIEMNSGYFIQVRSLINKLMMLVTEATEFLKSR